MRLIFWGTPATAVPFLKALCDAGHEVPAAVTQPDRKQGRKQLLQFSPVKQFALSRNISVLQPETPNTPEFIHTVSVLAPEIMVVVAYGEIFGDEILLALPGCKWLNVHFSLLPKYRGAAPLNAAILSGEKTTGVSVIRLVQRMDAGPVLAGEAVPIAADDTCETLGKKLEASGSSLLVDVLGKLAGIVETPQDERLATYCHTIRKEDGLIDWTKSAQYLERFARAMSPWPTAYTFLAQGGRAQPIRLIIRAATAVPGQVDLLPGTVIETCAGIDVATGEARLRISVLQREGKSPLGAEAFLRGTPIYPGDKLGPEP